MGYVQYFSDVPPLLVGIHVAGATTFWITVVRYYLRRFEPVPTDHLVHFAPDRMVRFAPEVANQGVATET